MLLFLITTLLVTSHCVTAVYSNKTSTIHFGAFVPFLEYFIDYGVPNGKDRFGYKAAIDMAVEIINNRSDILPDYKIQVHFGETFVSPRLKANSLWFFILLVFTLTSPI